MISTYQNFHTVQNFNSKPYVETRKDSNMLPSLYITMTRHNKSSQS